MSPQNPSGSVTDFSYISWYCTQRYCGIREASSRMQTDKPQIQLIKSSYHLSIFDISFALKLLRREEVVGGNSLHSALLSGLCSLILHHTYQHWLQVSNAF